MRKFKHKDSGVIDVHFQIIFHIYDVSYLNTLANVAEFKLVIHLAHVCVSVQGVLLLKPAVVAEGSTENGQKINRLWVHEVYRVFYDRLINEEDREMFFKMVKVQLILD